MRNIPPQNPKVNDRYDSAGALIALLLIAGIFLLIFVMIAKVWGLE